MAVLRGEQARQAYARAQHQRAPAQSSDHDDRAPREGDTTTSDRSDLSSAGPDAPGRFRAR